MLSQFYNNEMHNLKTVDKFQFIQEEGICDEEVTIIPAWHSVLNRAYTLKQIFISQNSKGRYAALLREVNILKIISGEWAIKCHKMLRTTHNVYIAYDRFGDHTLQGYLKAGERREGGIAKEEIAAKLIGLLICLQESKVVNLNILPKNIQVIERQLKESVEIALRINNFQYAVFLDEGCDIGLLETLKTNQFHPPQLVANPPIIGYHCHIYTIGKILQQLGLPQDQKTTFKRSAAQKERTHKLQQIIAKMTILDYTKRISSDQLSQFYSYFEGKKHNKIQRSKTMLNIPQIQHTKSISHNLSKKSLHQSSKQLKQYENKQQKSISKQIGLKIMKRRNLAIFLIFCSKIMSSIEYVQLQHTIKLSFILLKKSTQVITQLFKFLMTGYEIGLNIGQKDMRRYTKSQQYHTLQQIVQIQMSLSKIKLNKYLQKLGNDCPQLLSDPIFEKETQSQQINDEYLGDLIMFIIKILVQNKCINILSKEEVKYLLLMSYVKEFKNFQNMFQQLINQNIQLLHQQTLFVKIEELQKQQIISKIQYTLQQQK